MVVVLMHNTTQKEIKTILAALKPSQYRSYWRKWNGLEDFNTTDYKDELPAFIEEYIETHSRPFNEKEFKKSFTGLVKRNEDIRDKLISEIKENIEYYMNIAWNKYGFDKEYRYYSEEEFIEDEDAREEVIGYILNKGEFKDLPTYEQELDNAKIEHLADQREYLRDIAVYEFESMHADKKHGEKDRVDVSKVYEKFFASLPSEFKIGTNNFRVGYDIEITSKDIAESSSKNVKLGKYNFDALQSELPYIIEHYYELLGKQEEADAVFGYAISHPEAFKYAYTDGYYISPLNNAKRSIGKMFNLIKKKDPDYSIFGNLKLTDIEKVYNDRPVGFKGKVIISRHPYDIAGMSTDRGWTSCMNLVVKDGVENYNEYIEPTIMRCALIAYLVKDGDENINNPTSRLLIKAYTKKSQKINYKIPNWVLIVSDIYGTIYPKFAESVQSWINTYWNSKVKGKDDDEFKFVQDFYFERDDKPSVRLGDVR